MNFVHDLATLQLILHVLDEWIDIEDQYLPADKEKLKTLEYSQSTHGSRWCFSQFSGQFNHYI